MKFYNCSIDEFDERVVGKKCIAYGCGSFLSEVLLKIHPEIINKFCYFVDNEKHGQIYEFSEKKLPVYSVKRLLEDTDLDLVVIICVSSLVVCMEIYDELNKYDSLRNAQCYCASLMLYGITYYPKSVEYIQQKKKNVPRIRKLIHSFWFSGEEKPELQKKCIESWKRYCPDYEIKEWNMENYDTAKNKFMQQAISKHKWAFASDYARLDVVYRYGGIYLDMDVELIQSLDEAIHNEAFFSFDCSAGIELGSGFGAVQGHPLVKKLLEQYEDKDFIGQDGTLYDIPQPKILTPVFVENGLKRDGTMQMLGNVLIYPADYFSPVDYRLFQTVMTPNTIGIHHFDDAWRGSSHAKILQKQMEAAKRIKDLLGK